MTMVVMISPRGRKGTQAAVAEVLDHGVDGVEGVAVLPLRAWLDPGSAGMAAEGEIFSHLVAHGVLKVRESEGAGVQMISEGFVWLG
jgi:hypothetical protein